MEVRIYKKHTVPLNAIRCSMV